MKYSVKIHKNWWLQGFICFVNIIFVLACPVFSEEIIFSQNQTCNTQKDSMGKILIATCQFPISPNIPDNSLWIQKQMKQASEQNADVVHFPETALSGYPGVDFKDFRIFSESENREQLEKIMKLASELKLWVILGAIHPLSPPNKPHNSLYVIDSNGVIVERYDKRFCTDLDLKYFTPGDYFAVFEINGVRCGLLICYDVRFPELYRQYHKLGVQLMFHSFHNARMRKDNMLSKIIPPTTRARAGANYIFISMNNSSEPNSWSSSFITPDGLVQNQLTPNKPGVMVNLVDTTKKYYDASKPFRLDCINGKWHSGETVQDERSGNRRCH